jgi:3'(2'), 5'-bisphosphate nucleotidase
MIDILSIVEIAEAAGTAVMEVYGREDFHTTYKNDRSPLTLADTASHKLISGRLAGLIPAFPVLSEEAKTVPYEKRRSWQTYWLVDPLDGTKEFIKRNGEFTVNIALIRDGFPIMGVVHAPVLNATYFAAEGAGAFRRDDGGEAVKITVSKDPDGDLKIVASRSHAGEELERYLKKFGHAEYISKGSSLKLCLVAEGTAHLYPRLGPTMEWDTAAGQCVVEEAGGLVTDMSGERLTYNKESLLNDYFIVSCSKKLLEKARQLTS